MQKKIHWGIIGLGHIAHQFAADLLIATDAVLYGVASRDLKKAKYFAQKFNATSYYDSYEALAKDPNIDVLYIATPHVFHFENTMLGLQQNKHVLCEKPMGIRKEQVNIMIAEARARNLFLMEGIWTRFIPATEKLIELLQKKSIGKLHSLHVDFGFQTEFNPDNRLYSKHLGGGSLLDIGIYPIYLSLLSLGMPSKIAADAEFTVTEVDQTCRMQFDYADGAKALLESTFTRDTPTEAILIGEKGRIKLHRPFHQSQQLTIHKNGEEQVIEIPLTGNGYIHEIEEVHACLKNGQLESYKLPHQLSLDLISIIDRVKQEIGLQYDI